jgi:hypothetical protein
MAIDSILSLVLFIQPVRVIYKFSRCGVQGFHSSTLMKIIWQSTKQENEQENWEITCI